MATAGGSPGLLEKLQRPLQVRLCAVTKYNLSAEYKVSSYIIIKVRKNGI